MDIVKPWRERLFYVLELTCCFQSSLSDGFIEHLFPFLDRDKSNALYKILYKNNILDVNNLVTKTTVVAFKWISPIYHRGRFEEFLLSFRAFLVSDKFEMTRDGRLCFEVTVGFENGPLNALWCKADELIEVKILMLVRSAWWATTGSSVAVATVPMARPNQMRNSTS